MLLEETTFGRPEGKILTEKELEDKRLSTRKIKEVLRLHWESGLTQRQIARSYNLSSSTVSDYLARARIAGLSWPLPENLEGNLPGGPSVSRKTNP